MIVLFTLIGLIIGALILRPLLIWFVWNLVMPQVFGFNEISFGQSVGLTVLCFCFFNYSNFVSCKKTNE